MWLFKKRRTKEKEQNQYDETLGIKIIISTRSSMDVEYKGRVARFYGELGLNIFRAEATSMRWLSPRSDEPISKEERDKWIHLVNQYYRNAKEKVDWIDDQGEEYHPQI